MRHLTDEQRTAANTLDKSLVLMAAAGSGKTTVLVGRYLALLSQTPADSILAVTFTNEAADQLRRRILTELEKKDAAHAIRESVEQTSRIGTLHSFCYSVLDQYGSHIGLEPIQQILTAFEMLPVFETHFRQWRKQVPAEDLRALIQFFGPHEIRDLMRQLFVHRTQFRQAMALLDPREPESEFLSRRIARIAEPLFKSLEAYFGSTGQYSFDDLETLTLQILRQRRDVVLQLQKQIRYLLVDEFQDTSQLQWEILQYLIGDNPHKLFLVGDPKQSIYRFRSADVRVFLSVSETVKSAGGELLELTTNFRSHPDLIAEINRLAAPLFRTGKVPFSPMKPGREDAPSSEPALEFVRYPPETIEADHVAARVKALLAQGILAQDIALLFRVSDRIPDYHRSLREVGISGAGKRSLKLFENYDVLDLVYFLKAVWDPTNNFYLAAFLRSRYLNFSYADLLALTTGDAKSLFDTLSLQKPDRLNWFLELVEDGKMEVDAVLEALFENTGYFPQAREAFFQILKPLQEPGLLVPEAIARLDIWEREALRFSSALGEGEGENKVNLLTVHAAKGLEFSHVLLVDNLRASPKRSPPLRLEIGKPPGWRYRQDTEMFQSKTYQEISELQNLEEAEETRRILYVALTRAKETLAIFLPEAAKSIPKGSFGAMLTQTVQPTT